MAPARWGGNQTVKCLLVDDLAENLLALEGLLREDGLEIMKAMSGTEALELLLDNDFALAIVDVQMPGMDGFELAELMRWSVRTCHVPIIFLTAGGADDRRMFRGYEAGAVDFLFKPIEPAIMRGKAQVFFDLYRQRREVVQQRDVLRSTMEENSRLYDKIILLNETLEERVKDRTAQLVAANELFQGFTYSVAHDFREKTQDVNANALILLSEAADSLGAYRSNVEQISHLAGLLNEMTDDLLSYAHTGNVTIRKVEIDLSALTTEIASAFDVPNPSARIRVAGGLHVCADRTLVRILMQNLIDNAIKYSQHFAEPLVEVGADDHGFFVRDNGIGFDMVNADAIFLPFERLGNASEINGRGMGLANVKRIVERHAGTVCADSEPGKGTTIHFCLGP